MQKRKWRSICGTQECYEVSNQGEIRNTRTGRMLKLSKLGNKAYLKFTASVAGIRETRIVHIEVARAFLPREAGKRDVNHKNGIKTYNQWRNLEWTTKKGNSFHAYHTLRIRSKVTAKGGNCKLTPAEKAEVKRIYKARSKTRGAVALGHRFGVHRKTIENIVHQAHKFSHASVAQW